MDRKMPAKAPVNPIKRYHVEDGFPHISHRTRCCMCLDTCCNGVSGCICKQCICRSIKKDHSQIVSPTWIPLPREHNEGSHHNQYGGNGGTRY